MCTIDCGFLLPEEFCEYSSPSKVEVKSAQRDFGIGFFFSPLSLWGLGKCGLCFAVTIQARSGGQGQRMCIPTTPAKTLTQHCSLSRSATKPPPDHECYLHYRQEAVEKERSRRGIAHSVLLYLTSLLFTFFTLDNLKAILRMQVVLAGNTNWRIPRQSFCQSYFTAIIWSSSQDLLGNKLSGITQVCGRGSWWPYTVLIS